jgi:branched-chain amino acid transport system ATP-binding protein
MLELQDLQVAYGPAPALWGVSLRLGAGELLCVVVPNGAGETTLMNAVSGTLRARAGKILLDGRDLTTLAPPLFCEAGIARGLRRLMPVRPSRAPTRLCVKLSN